MPRTGRYIAEIPVRGATGSARGHVWVIAAISAFRCEGLDPWADRPTFAQGHSDIAVGESFLRKLWRIEETSAPERGDYTAISRHCIWCGRAIETARDAGERGGRG